MEDSLKGGNYHTRSHPVRPADADAALRPGVGVLRAMNGKEFRLTVESREALIAPAGGDPCFCLCTAPEQLPEL